MTGRPAQITYRADIDGLRALAVVAVVLYHFKLGPFVGGFVGVDVFYVISGFLITSIIQHRIEEHRFTFAWFYERRVRRLFPALAVVLALTLAAGAWLLLPSDLALLGKSTASTLLFISNVFFWRTSDYFNSDSELNPLLHMWSLSVEEQFYIGLPLLLLAVHRFAPHRLVTVLLLSASASFAACVLVTRYSAPAAFYLAPFRAWELLAGALLAVAPLPPIKRSPWRELVAGIGLALVVGSLLWIRPGPDFPGWRALGPVLGTALLILSGDHGGSIVHRLLRLRPVVYIGLISYSLYLWHWPLLVYARYLNALEPLQDLRWPLIAASVVVAALSYHFIELPFRRPQRAGTAADPLFRNTVMASAALGTVAIAIALGQGLPLRFSPAVVALDQERNPAIPFRVCDQRPPLHPDDGRCRLGADGVAPSILVWGDSHALSWAPAFDQVLRHNGLAARLMVNLGCPPLIGIDDPANAGCGGFNDDVLAFLRREHGYSLVVLIASWTNYSNSNGEFSLADRDGRIGNEAVFEPALRETVQRLRDARRSVWIIGPTPGAPSAAPLRLAMASMRSGPPPPPKSRRAFTEEAAGFDAVAAALDRNPDIAFTDPVPWFCDVETCAFVAGGLPLYRDGGHLNRHGQRYIQPFLETSLAQLMASMPNVRAGAGAPGRFPRRPRGAHGSPPPIPTQTGAQSAQAALSRGP
jgi:peptidoglycan/LPS O-acetylase OafA/YrhL